jgi:hypothetical protein
VKGIGPNDYYGGTMPPQPYTNLLRESDILRGGGLQARRV